MACPVRLQVVRYRTWEYWGHKIINGYAGSSSSHLRFVRKAINQGRRPELVGGRLLRSIGGWSALKAIRDIFLARQKHDGIVAEIVARQLNRPATHNEVSDIKTKTLELLKSQARADSEKFASIPGALDLFCSLRKMKTCGVAIATGCWKESANLKLSTAGFDLENLPLASSDDSHRREEIMGTAHNRAIDFWGVSEFETVTYVGDGVWDLKGSNTQRTLGRMRRNSLRA